MTNRTRLPYVKGSDTSEAAAESMEPHAPTLRHRVFRYILEQGDLGATDSQIEIALQLRHQTASARRRELELMGAVVRTGQVRKTASGRNAGVYVAVPGVNIDRPRGRKPKPDGAARSRRVTINLTRAEYAAICEVAADREVEVSTMARALMVHGYQVMTGALSTEVML
ncbi:MAG: hypothetical protein QF464_01175 [Myxococcota bacterium]|jgi:orotidine-5'-phosphate decarboxylase|nr:hypothetical protein [Myxococcota bacterium]